MSHDSTGGVKKPLKKITQFSSADISTFLLAGRKLTQFRIFSHGQFAKDVGVKKFK